MLPSLAAPPFVIPAKAGIQLGVERNRWIPAFVGMTNV